MAALEKAMTEVPSSVQTRYNASIRDMRDVLEDAFQAGLSLGRAQMRNAILAAANASEPMPSMTGDEYSALKAHSHREQEALNPRAPRGAVRSSIVAALSAKPGSTERELAQAMERIDPTVSGRSAGGELRRLKGRLYRQDGGRWFLMGEAVQTQMETAETQNSAVPQPQTT